VFVEADREVMDLKRYARFLSIIIICGFFLSLSCVTEPIAPQEFITVAAEGDSFTMGDGTYGPDVSQTISYSFQLSKYEVTNEQFSQFITQGGYSNSSYWTSNGWIWKTNNNIKAPAYWQSSDTGFAFGCGVQTSTTSQFGCATGIGTGFESITNPEFNRERQPVTGISWYEAIAFCNWLSLIEGLTPAYDGSGNVNLSASGYRLPTEVEWEYAAAKGASTESERIYAYGTIWNCNNVVSSVPPCSAIQTAIVGSKSHEGDTPQGLSDMSGNVWEWCSDNYQDDITVFGDADRYHFIDDNSSTELVCRGGAWNSSNERFLRSAYRFSFFPDNRDNSVGFRVIRTLQ
jgi:formylglycine-generating enzyme required for sulfatase activity